MRTFVALAVLAVAIGIGRGARADEAPDPQPPIAAAPVEQPPPPATPLETPAQPPVEPPHAEVLPGPVNERSFAGSIQLDYLAVPTDRRARREGFDGATVETSLKLAVDLGGKVSANVKVCVACHGPEFGMAYFDLRLSDALNIRVGRFTPSFGSFPIRHDPANHHTSDKPLPYDMGRMLHSTEWNQGVLPAPWVDNGLELEGSKFFGHSQFDYALYAISGPKGGSDGNDFDYTLSRSGERYYVDNNSEPTVGGRLALTLGLGRAKLLSLGGSVMAGHYDPDAKLGFAIAAGDMILQIDRVFLRAEYLVRRTQISLGDDPMTRFKYGPGTKGTYDDHVIKDGFYVELEAPVGPVDLIGRWDGMRRIGNVLATSPLRSTSIVLRYTAAVAVRVSVGFRIKASFEVYDFSDFNDELATHLALVGSF